MITVRAVVDHGLVGKCGVNYKFPMGDKFKCFDDDLGFSTSCYVLDPKVYRCCISPWSCDDVYNEWYFGK